MIAADYFCDSCQNTWEYWKEVGADFPKTPPCPKCNSTNTRKLWKFGMGIVKEGFLGNSKTGYSGSK